jgi:ABC-2 type transport system permease protein
VSGVGRRTPKGAAPTETSGADTRVPMSVAKVPRGPRRAVLAITWQSWMAARSFFFLLAFGWMMPPVVALFIWRAVASGGTVGAFNQSGITLYYLAVIVVNQFTMTQANWTVGDNIRAGHINSLLLRPFHPLADATMIELAGKGVFLTFALPMAVLLGVILRPEFAIRAADIVLFVPALLLAWLLRFSWGLALALLAFRAAKADSLLTVQETLVDLVGGILAPVSLLPPLLGSVARVLPFRSMVGFPVEVLTGSLGRAEVISGMATQAAWLAVSLCLCAITWKTGLAHHEAVGG